MTPSKAAKQAGLKSLKEMSELSGYPIRTLQDMYRDRPARFNVVLQGVLKIKIDKSADVV